MSKYCMSSGYILEAEKVSAEYFSSEKDIPALRGVDISLREGECIGIAGESGSGKSTLALTLLQLIDEDEGRISGGNIVFHEKASGEKINISSINKSRLRKVRGKEISLITQDPYTSFNPVIKLYRHFREAYRVHNKVFKERDLKDKVSELLDSVNLRPAEKILNSYPHQFSGGMLQRASMALALLNGPRILIADEPTSSLDVTIQKKVMETLKDLRCRYNLSIIFISHDLNLISEIADRIYILYAGKTVESGPASEIFKNPRHPYTEALLKSLPKLGARGSIISIPGRAPQPGAVKEGCSFAPRCSYADKKCFKKEPPPVLSGERAWACFKRQ